MLPPLQMEYISTIVCTMKYHLLRFFLLGLAFYCCSCQTKPTTASGIPGFRLVSTPRFLFNSFVDCNMASVWVGDTFRIFPGKYGEDPLWGDSRELKFASGASIDEVFRKPATAFTEPLMPPNAAPGKPGLHGAVWFETLYRDKLDTSGKTLYALYHNENYPSTLPYDSIAGSGYRDIDWPQGLRGPGTKTAVCRIGIMKSADGGHSWQNKGIVLEDLQPRLILRPHNTGINFAGGTGDPSAIVSGDYLYIFYGEYGYPATYQSSTYDTTFEWSGQCISIARLALQDLDNPAGKAKRWDGKNFTAAFDTAGKPVSSLQIALTKGGGPASSPTAQYYWGPSVSWNEYLQCWVMLMARATGPSWKGSAIYISFNKNPDLGAADAAQQWSAPQLLLDKPGHIIWYPSLQPVNNAGTRYTSLRLGQKARLFFKDMEGEKSEYLSEYLLEFYR
jgi:hypothetical protein